MTIRHEPASNSAGDVFRHYVGDIVYGANDGLVTTFTVVSGVAGAGLTPTVVIILGFVNLIADGFSMGASNYLAIRSHADAEGKSRGIREPLFHGIMTFLSFVLIGSVPLLAYVIPPARDHAFLVSCLSTGGALFAVGASRSLVSERGWLRAGVEVLLVGLVAAVVAYEAGLLLARWTRAA